MNDPQPFTVMLTPEEVAWLKTAVIAHQHDHPKPSDPHARDSMVEKVVRARACECSPKAIRTGSCQAIVRP